ncbi:MAG: hypothetical protein ABSG97_08240 [Sedimentisphaerales bacterium]|jgi:hypothetical protein
MLARGNKQKRVAIITMVVVLLTAGWAYFAFAADPMMKGKGMMDSNDMMMQKGMMGKAMPMMCPMHTMMAQGMMHKEIVATQDGGVIVMYDNKLLKYDKDVNFVKEVDLKIDTAAMQAKMQRMMKECMEKCQMMKPQEKPAGSM